FALVSVAKKLHLWRGNPHAFADRRSRTICFGPESDKPFVPWGSNRHPTDAAKRHVENTAVGRHAYTIRQGGTMDGANCRSPVGVGMMDGPAIEQIWESNRTVRHENVGETDVVNPWLSNGR